MLNRLSNARTLVTIGSVLKGNARRTPMTAQQRLSSDHYWGYREHNYDKYARFNAYGTEIAMGIVWWWILWNFYTEWQHLVGHYVWPEQSGWSDEHLGIPSDDED